MFLFQRHKTELVAPEDALPGRDATMPVPERHDVLGTPITPPFPDGYESLVVGLGCFWGAERIFWKLPGVYTTAVGYAGGLTKNPTYEEVCSGRTGHTEAVLVVWDPEKTSREDILRAFWEGHDPTQGMRQGNDTGTQYRSAIYVSSPEQRAAAEATRDAVPARADRRRLRRDHDRDRRRRAVLLRRAVPPAVPREEPDGLLRARRHGRLLPGRVAGLDVQQPDRACPRRGLTQALLVTTTPALTRNCSEHRESLCRTAPSGDSQHRESLSRTAPSGDSQHRESLSRTAPSGDSQHRESSL